MKNFLFLLLGILCSIQCLAQKKLFIAASDSNVKSEISLWVKDNNYLLSTDRTKTDYIIVCEEIKRKGLKGDFVYISLLDSNEKVVNQTKTVYARNKEKEFVKLVETELKSLIKVAIQSADTSFKATFSDTLVTVTRSKTENVTVRSRVLFTSGSTPSIQINNVAGTYDTNVDKGRPNIVSTDEVEYYFEFENKAVKAEFKDNTDILNTSELPKSHMIEVNILPDTTIKMTMTYKVQLFYRKKGEKDYSRDKFFTIKVLAKEAPIHNPFHKNELILFAGTTYDHFNPSNKITGLSIEPMLTTKVNEKVWVRFGMFFHPNFSRDTSVANYIQYYRIDDGQLTSNKSQIVRHSQQVGIGQKIQSIGLYTDFLFVNMFKSKLEKGIRISPAAHIEVTKRIMTPTSSFARTSTDTLIYSASAMRGIDIQPSKVSSDLIKIDRRIINQFIVGLSWMLEVSMDNIYIFFQPNAGANFEFSKTPRLSSYETRLTSGYKFSIRYKELISLSIDHRDFLRKQEYLNISFGVPITIANLLKTESK